MKKKILAITLSLCLIASTAFAGFADGGAFGSMANYLKRVGTSIVPSVTATYNLGSASKTWDTIYAATVSVTNWVWTGGNVTYLSISGNIETAIAAATAGDTIVLAAGTYTITDDIDIAKAINVVGQGVGQTTIACATASKNVFDIAASDVRIAGMTMTVTGAGSKGISTSENLSGLLFEDLYISLSSTGNLYAVGLDAVSGTMRNVEIYSTSSDDRAYCIYYYNDNSATTDNTFYFYNVKAVADGTGDNTIGIYMLNTNDANTLTAYLYNCNITALEGGDGKAIQLYSVTTNSLVAYCYGCTLNGYTYDAQVNGTNTLTLYGGTNLVNGTTSGTITYGGTVVTNTQNIVNDSTTLPALLVDANGTTGTTGESAVRIDSENTDVAAFYITSANDGSGTSAIFDDFALVAVSEGNGGAASFYRNVASANREIVKIYEDSPTAVGKVLRVYTDQNDSASSAMVDFQSTSPTYDQPVLQVTQAGTGDAVSLTGGVIVGDEYSVAKQHDEIGDLLGVLTSPVAIVGFTGTGADASTENGYESGSGRVWTYNNTTTADKIFQGSTYVLDFDGTDDYLSTPDTADMSFDDSGANPFSIGGWVEVVAGSGARTIIARRSATEREYYWNIQNAEEIRLTIYDQSAGVGCFNTTDAGLSEGWHFVVTTYDSSGGATAGNGIKHYVDGVLVASTPTNDASYVAMENLGLKTLIGAENETTPASFWGGDMGRLFVTPEELTAAQVWQMYEESRGYYNM